MFLVETANRFAHTNIHINFCLFLQLAMQILTATSCELVNLPGDSDQTAGIFFKGQAGTCEDSQFETDDGIVTGARTALMVSTCAGFIAGAMVTFEWLFCEICCAGLLEGLGFLVAWMAGSATFMFYGADFCKVDGGDAECAYTDASAMLTVAIICYFGCGVLLCL